MELLKVQTEISRSAMDSTGNDRVAYEVLKNVFLALGLRGGDCVLVHSSLKSALLYFKRKNLIVSPQTVLDALLAVLGPHGTLILPTFHFGFCRGETFDIRHTPSQMGVMTEIFRQSEHSVRTQHPIYSFALCGRHADLLSATRNVSAYGNDSVFGKLRDLHAKIMIIGLPYNNSMTYFHHIEEMEGCDYRYLKSFTGTYIDGQGKSSVRTYQMLVRDIERGVETQVEPMGCILEDRGLVNRIYLGERFFVKLMEAEAVYERTAIEMKRDPRLLYQIKNLATA